MKPFPVPKQGLGSSGFHKTLLSVALLLFAMCPAFAQWQRIEMDAKGGVGNSVLGAAHPLPFYLMPSSDRDPSNSLCLGCKVKDGRAVSLSDFDVESSRQLLGESFVKKIFQIELSFAAKKRSVVERLHREWEQEYKQEGQNVSFDSLPPAEWKSIVMESSPDMYKELYLIIDEGTYVRPLGEARLLTVGDVRLLATNDPADGNGGFCTEGYWVLQADGPWLLDFTAVHQEIDRVIPRDATAPQTGCWALSIDNAEVRSPIQLKGAECRACGYVGTAVVHFKVKDHRAVPVSSSFE